MMTVVATCRITPQGCVYDGREVAAGSLTDIYRTLIGGYPKFFKMDPLCRLGFVAAELLLRDLDDETRAGMAVVLFNRMGSVHADRAFEQTIIDPGQFYPSPATFVYTLANIVTGEIAIRHKISGETSFYILPDKNPEQMRRLTEDVALTAPVSHALSGWVEYVSEVEYEADFKIYRYD